MNPSPARAARSIRLPWFFGLLAALAAVFPALADDYDRWYVLKIADQRAGWMRMLQKTTGDRIESKAEISIELKRGPVAIKISMEGQFVETADGKPVSMVTKQQLGNVPMVTEFTFTEAAIESVTRQGGQETRQTKPLPKGVWLTPAAATSYVAQRLAAGAEEITVRSIDPFSGSEPVTVTRSGLERTTVEAMGKTVPAIKCSTVVSTMAAVTSTEYLDDRGLPVRSQTNLGGLEMVTLAAERELAMAPLDAPEVMASSFVRPDRTIPNPRRLERGVYRLSLPEGDMPDVPSCSVQRAERLDRSTVQVTVDLSSAAPAPENEAAGAAYLANSPMIAVGDPVITGLVAKATHGIGASQAERAEAMRRFVHAYIDKKDLDVGFASASEVARARKGDCSEHGMLLAAMLRTDGIPSRVASGLLYVDEFAGSRGIFGYHMWAQALLTVDGKATWVDLDGTLPGDRPTDATHIALVVSALGEDETQNAFVALATLLGRLQIAVVEPTEPR